MFHDTRTLEAAVWRAVERLLDQRPEDADYWKAIAPSALGRARDWRAADGFAGLPG